MNRLERTAILSICGNALVSIVKFLAGTAFGSVALVADAVHSFTDIIGSVGVFFGARFSDIKSEKFPYGLYKLENLVSLFISLIVFGTGVEIALESWAKIAVPSEIRGLEAIAAAAFSLVIVFALAKYKEKVGKEENSPSMKSEARHSLLDAYGSVGVIAGLALASFGFPAFDPLIGLAIAVLVFRAGAEIFLDSVRVLLDISLDYKTMRKIERIAAAEKSVRVKGLVARNSGRYVFVELKLETGLKDLKRVSMLRNECEAKIRKAIPRIDSISIEVEYRKKPFLVYATALEGKSLESRIAKEFGSAKYFGIARVENKEGNRVASKTIVENPHWKSSERKGILAAEFLAKNDVDVLFVREEMHKGGAFYALQDNFVEIRKAGRGTFNELLEGKEKAEI